MITLGLGTRQASMVWLEPQRVHAGGRARALSGPVTPDSLVMALDGLPPGPTRWVVDDAWIPSLLVRDLVEIPSGAEAREGFFRWRFRQALGLEAPQVVQALALGDNAWLLLGVAQETREAWVHAALVLGRPLRSLQPRWLWLYNRLAAGREVPGLLLSLRPHGDGAYSGTLAAWGRHLTLVRQWTEPATPEAWNQDRVLPSVAYLQREAHTPQEMVIWGAPDWPQGPVPAQLLPAEIPAQERL